MSILTQSELKENLHYCSKTGIFCRLGANIKVGNFDKDGYLIIKVNYVNYKAHRLAWLYMYGAFPDSKIDHINGIRDDNRILNLRICNDFENARNVGLRSDNTSGHKGVSYFKQTNKWKAYASLNKKIIHLGFYKHIEDAAKAYEDFTRKHYGEFFRDKNAQ